MNKFRAQMRKHKEVSDSDIQEMRRTQEQYAQLKLGMAQQIAGLGEHVDVVGKPNRVALYDLLEQMLNEGEVREGTLPLLGTCLKHLTPLDWAADFVCAQAGGRNVFIKAAKEGWYQTVELILTLVPNLTIATTEDLKEVLEIRERERVAREKKVNAAADDDDEDDILADIGDDNDDIQPLDSCGDFLAVDTDISPPKKKTTTTTTTATTSGPSPSASPAKARSGTIETEPFIDPVELLKICVHHQSARIPLVGTLCKHWSLLRFVEYCNLMLPLWREFVAGLCSRARCSQQVNNHEDKPSRLGMLQRILSLSSAIPVNVNEVESASGDGGDDEKHSLLSRAIVEGETEVFRVLCKKGGEVDWRAKLPDGHSLLTLACACSQRAIVEILLAQPLVDVMYEAPGQGSALEIVKSSGGGNAQIVAMLEKRIQQMEDIKLAAESERLMQEQASQHDTLRKKLAGKKKSARPANPPKWVEAKPPTVTHFVDPVNDEDWSYDKESKPEVVTGPVLDVCNTLREHWELVKNGGSKTNVLEDGEKKSTTPASATAAAAANDDVTFEKDDDNDEKKEGDESSPVFDKDGGDDSAAAATAAAANESNNTTNTNNAFEEDQEYLLDGTTLRADLANTLLGLGTRLIVEGKDPREKVHNCVARLLSEGSAVPGSLKLARLFLFRIATVDFSPSIGGTLKWALRAAQRGDVEALDSLLAVDKLWREEHEVVELVMCCVRYSNDELRTKLGLCLTLLRHMKELRFGTYKDHLRPLWEELVEAVANPAKISLQPLLAEEQQYADQMEEAASTETKASIIGGTCPFHRHDYDNSPSSQTRVSRVTAPVLELCALRFELLCRLFANPGFFQLRHDIELTQGITWFSRACRIGDCAFVRAAVAYNASDINKIHSNKSTPLLQAIVGDQLEVVRILCACPDLDLLAEGPGGTTALLLAKQMKRSQAMVDALMQAAEMQTADATGATA